MDNQQPSLDFRPYKYDSNYLIYSDGRVFNKKVNRFLKGKIGATGYQEFALAIGDKRSINGKKLSKMIYGHRLVAETFLPNPNNLPYVHHKDNNRLNNSVDNLEWVTALENNLEAQNDPTRKSKSKTRYYTVDLPNEKWKVIPFDLTYSISSCGRVRNNRTNRLLKKDDHQRYSRIQLSDKKHYYIHRLVYCVFNNDFDLDGFVIDHIDADPKNNNLNNLQKILQSENCLKQGRFND